MWRDALLVAGKDLRIEVRSRVVLNQVLPFGLLVLMLFGFALGPDRLALAKAAPGLFWVTVLFAAVLAVQRSVAVESADSAGDGLRMSGLDPAGIFLGKTAAVALELAALEIVLAAAVFAGYGVHLRSIWLMVAASVAGTVGVAATGTLYGTLSAGTRARETLLPLLLLPVAAPVLVAGTRSWQAGLGSGSGVEPWVRILLVFAAVYLAVGVALFGALQESS